MQSIGLVRDERAAPLFVYILGHVDHRGALAPVYAARDRSARRAAAIPSGVAAAARGALQQANGGRRGGPRRCAPRRPRRCARIGTAAASPALEEAVAHGPRGVRAARAQPQLRKRVAADARARATHERARASSSRTNCSRRFAAALRSAQLYSPGHPIVGAQPRRRCRRPCRCCTRQQPTIAIGIVGDEVIVADTPMPKADTHGGPDPAPASRPGSSASRSSAASPRTSCRRSLQRRSRRSSAPRRATRPGRSRPAAHPRRPRHRRAARSSGSQRHGERSGGSTATPSSVAGVVWESAREPKASPTPPRARSMIDGLAAGRRAEPHRAARADRAARTTTTTRSRTW